MLLGIRFFLPSRGKKGEEGSVASLLDRLEAKRAEKVK
jgi:hypothetical protein